ncbi:LysR substrate-binding domain-containing protein [Streptomyces coelicoflavus]
MARAIATGHGATGGLRLGYMSAAVARRVLPLVDAFHAGRPGCRVTIRETALDDLYEPLRRADVDLSVLPLPVAEPDLTRAGAQDAFGCSLSEDHRLVRSPCTRAGGEHVDAFSANPAPWGFVHRAGGQQQTARSRAMLPSSATTSIVAAALPCARRSGRPLRGRVNRQRRCHRAASPRTVGRGVSEPAFLQGLQSLGGLITCFQDAWSSMHPDDPGPTFTSGNPLVGRGDMPEAADRRIDYLTLRCGAYGSQSAHLILSAGPRSTRGRRAGE